MMRVNFTKICEACGGKYRRKEGEKAYLFRHKRSCSAKCAVSLRNRYWTVENKRKQGFKRFTSWRKKK